MHLNILTHQIYVGAVVGWTKWSQFILVAAKTDFSVSFRGLGKETKGVKKGNFMICRNDEARFFARNSKMGLNKKWHFAWQEKRTSFLVTLQRIAVKYVLATPFMVEQSKKCINEKIIFFYDCFKFVILLKSNQLIHIQNEKCWYTVENVTSSPTFAFEAEQKISSLSPGAVLSGIHWNWAAQAITPRYSTLGLAMSLKPGQVQHSIISGLIFNIV